MLDPIVASGRWNEIESYLDKIEEPNLAASMRTYFQKRAEEEWGYCPIQTKSETEKPFMSPDEESFLERLETGIMFGQYIEPEEPVRPLLAQIYEFVAYENGSFYDLPKHLQTKEIEEVFNTVESRLKSELDAQIEALLSDKK